MSELLVAAAERHHHHPFAVPRRAVANKAAPGVVGGEVAVRLKGINIPVAEQPALRFLPQRLVTHAEGAVADVIGRIIEQALVKQLLIETAHRQHVALAQILQTGAAGGYAHHHPVIAQHGSRRGAGAGGHIQQRAHLRFRRPVRQQQQGL